MDPENPISIADVVISTAGRDQGELFYVADINDQFVTLVNGKNRPVEKPKRKKRKHVEKVLRSETRVAEKIRSGDKVLNGELRRDLASLSRAIKQTTWEVNDLAKDDVIELEGIVTDALPNAMFKVDIGNGHTILAHISGRLRMNFIKILPGDKVTVQMSPYDLTQGRITWRSK